MFQPSWFVSVRGVYWYVYLIYIGYNDCGLSLYGFLPLVQL